jgi:hypothetical protein
MTRKRFHRALVVILVTLPLFSKTQAQPSWKSLPETKPQGHLTDIGGYTVRDPANTHWDPAQIHL